MATVRVSVFLRKTPLLGAFHPASPSTIGTPSEGTKNLFLLAAGPPDAAAKLLTGG